MSLASHAPQPSTPLGEEPTHDLGDKLGVYQLVSVLGEGGMGRVYLAEHTLLGRQVAIKVLRSEFANDPFVVKRFFAEARTVNQISHENIVEITDFVDGEDGTSFIVMEYLRGRPLSEVLSDGPLGIRRTVHITRQIASALAAVHAVGIVHRDLKPDNIVLVERPNEADFVKLLDFGAAKLNPKVVPGSVQTQAVTLIGTPQYMSPEQATGAPIDHRSDIYALGVVLYEMVTGGNPFAAADTWSVIRRQVTLEPDQVDTVVSIVPPCPNLSDLIMACLDKEPERRPSSMGEVEAVLAAIERDLTPAARAAPTPRARPAGDSRPSTLLLREAGVGPSRRRPLVLGAGAAVILAAGLGLGFSMTGDQAGVAAMPIVAPAVAPAATAPAAPAPVTDRQVLLRSEPSGAEVRLAGSAELLGKTPLTVRIPVQVESRRFALSAPGYEAREVEVKNVAGAAPVTTLERRARPAAAKKRATKRVANRSARPEPAPEAKPAARPEKAPAATKVGRNGVIDPFAD